MAQNYPPLTFNYRYPNGSRVPDIGVPQNPMRRFAISLDGYQNQVVRNGWPWGWGRSGGGPPRKGTRGIGCGGGCGCASCGGNKVTDTLAGVGRKSLRGLTLGQLDETQVGFAVPRWVQVAHGVLSMAGGAMGGYHGWKRTHRAWPTVGYAALGVFIPLIGIPVMLAQGFGKRKGR